MTNAKDNSPGRNGSGSQTTMESKGLGDAVYGIGEEMRSMIRGYPRRTFLQGGLLLGAAGILGACGNDKTGAGAQIADLIAMASKSEFPEDLVKAAQKDGTVSLYTSQEPPILKSIVAAFESKFPGIKVDAYRATAADVAVRAIKEFKANRLQADVIDATSIASFLTMSELGMLQKFRPPRAADLAQEGFAAADQTWTADRVSIPIIFWNTDLVKKGPGSWKELTDPQWKNKLTTWYTDAGSEIPGLYTVGEKYGYDLLERIAANGVTLQSSQATLAQAVAKGDVPVGFNMTEDHVYRIRKSSSNIDFVYPSDGAVAELAAVGMAINSAHPAAALLFVNWWLSATSQDLVVAGGKYSPMKSAEPPKGSPKIAELNLLTVDDKKLAKDRQAIVDRIHRIYGR